VLLTSSSMQTQANDIV